MAFPRMHPDAIDVTGPVPVNGKPWSGGSGNRKFVLHTIEGGADPWTIGWPRDWTRVTAAPHLYVNSDRFPDGDWIYQTLPFDVAGYSLRDNTGEAYRYVWQVEMAGQAAKVPGYPDSFYQMVAALADFFVAEMGVPDVWRDFSCCEYGTYTPCRITRTEMDRFAGFMGHCQFGRGIDSHGDPGRLDVPRVQSFMDGGQTPPDEEEQMLKLGDTGKTVTHYQERLMDWRSTALPVSGADGDYGAETEQWVGSFQTTEDLEKTGTVDGLTAARLDSFAEDLVDVKLRRDLVAVQKESNAADEAHADTPHGDEEHTHPQYALDGHTHPGLAIVTHTHPFTGNTEGAVQP